MGVQTTVPSRELGQRLDALLRANRIRTQRADMKKDVKAGRRNVLDVLAHPPEFAMTMKVIDLLLATPKIGRVKAEKALRTVKVSPSKTLGGLTDRQRTELAQHVRPRR